ncbi:MAG: hypothetical protein DRO05_00875 [Thermoproteota archaeon]|nr:MAG: hypothetical protein DRO05_00875 [Candidatus Korarchaeota archaeon]
MKERICRTSIDILVLIGLIIFFGKTSSSFFHIDMESEGGFFYTLAVFLAGWILGKTTGGR